MRFTKMHGIGNDFILLDGFERGIPDPDGLAAIKKSNLETYGDEMGPTTDSLYEKYGSWQTVLEKALGTNAGMDACLGFYDEYYDYYDIG